MLLKEDDLTLECPESEPQLADKQPPHTVKLTQTEKKINETKNLSVKMN